MSHIATVDVAIKDKKALAAACRRLGLHAPVHQKFTFYDGTEAEGESVKFPQWQYPVVFQDGKVFFDNFNGSWGDIKHLNALKQAYALEAAKSKARQQGFSVSEHKLTNGQYQLICSKG